MARCEQGYLCEVCGQEVEEITESDLYLGYVLGEVPAEELPRRRERHIRCNPERAQYIIDPGFEPVVCEGFFAKGSLEPGYVAAVVIQKALFLGLAGYVPGFAIALLVYHLSKSVTNLPGGMTVERAVLVFVLTLSACCLSSLAALRILRRANPVDLFAS